MYVPELKQYCTENNLAVDFEMVVNPAALALLSWSGNPAIFGDPAAYAATGLSTLYCMFGSKPQVNHTEQQIIDYIEPLQQIRGVKMQDACPELYKVLYACNP